MKHFGLAVACGTIGLIMLFLATGASARQFTEAECGGLATTAGQVVNARTNAIPYADVLASLNASIASKSPTSYITNEQDAILTRELMELVYKSKLSYDQTVQTVYHACMPPKRSTSGFIRST